MSAPVPRYAIHFYDYKWIQADNQSQEIKSVILIDDVAKRLKVSDQDILNAFRLWGEAGYPQEYFLATDTGQKSRGGSYDIGIHIWNYQGGNKGDSTPAPNQMGVITKSRVWGNGYQQIEACRKEFYLGALA
jgi:hypothetical protein